MIRIFLIFVIIVCMQFPVYSQKITKLYKGLALVDISPDDGYYANDEIDVYRENVIGEPIKVGKVRVIKFDKKGCATKIIEEDKQFPIQIGDFVPIKNLVVSYEEMSGGEWKSSNLFSYTASGLGLATIAMGVYFKGLADDKYDAYETVAYDPNALDLYNKAAKFEKRSYVCYAVGGGLLTAGVIHFFLKKKWEQSPLYEQSSLVPQIIPETRGIRIQLTYHITD